MLLVIDVGNTNIVLGVYDGQNLVGHWRISTDKGRTTDEYGVLIMNLFFHDYKVEAKHIDAIIISSVVPPLMPTLERVCLRYFNVKPIIVGPGTKTGMAIVFSEADVNPTGRASLGVIGVRFKQGSQDEVVGADVLTSTDEVLTLSSDAYAKRNKATAYTVQQRGGQGARNFKKGSTVVGLLTVKGNEEMLVITESGIVIRVPVDSISLKKGKNTIGVKVQRLDETDRIASVALAPMEETEED